MMLANETSPTYINQLVDGNMSQKNSSLFYPFVLGATALGMICRTWKVVMFCAYYEQSVINRNNLAILHYAPYQQIRENLAFTGFPLTDGQMMNAVNRMKSFTYSKARVSRSMGVTNFNEGESECFDLLRNTIKVEHGLNRGFDSTLAITAFRTRSLED